MMENMNTPSDAWTHLELFEGWAWDEYSRNPSVGFGEFHCDLTITVNADGIVEIEIEDDTEYSHTVCRDAPLAVFEALIAADRIRRGQR